MTKQLHVSYQIMSSFILVFKDNILAETYRMVGYSRIVQGQMTFLVRELFSLRVQIHGNVDQDRNKP